MTNPKPLSPTAQAVLDAYGNEVGIPRPYEHERHGLAAALRALTRTPLVGEAHMRGWIVSAIATEDLLDIAAELENHNG